MRRLGLVVVALALLTISLDAQQIRIWQGRSWVADLLDLGGGEEPASDFGGYRPQYPPVAAAFTAGGRGGVLFFVDSLTWTQAEASCVGNCNGNATTNVCDTVTCFRGGLKACVDRTGSRYCLPTVSGYIDMPFAGDDTYIVDPDDYTLAFQTAPSPGLSLRYSGLGFGGRDGVVQHLRVRVGYHPTQGPCGSGILLQHPDTGRGDKVVLDHVSVAWGMDDNLGVGTPATDDFLIYRSLTGASLGRHNNTGGGGGSAPNCPQIGSFTPPGAPGHCFGVGNAGDDHYIAIIETVVTNCRERMIWNGGGRARLVILNNIIHGISSFNTVSVVDSDGGSGVLPTFSTIAGNRFVANSLTCGTAAHLYEFAWNALGNQVYFNDNTVTTPIDDGGSCANIPTGMFVYPDPYLEYDPTVGSPPAKAPIPSAGGWTIRTSNAAMQTLILDNAGARPSDRDSLDTLLIDDVVTKTTRILADHTNPGAFPTLANNGPTALAIPANPHAVASGETFRTNIEVWLESKACEVEPSC